MKKRKRWEFGKFKFEGLKGKDALEIADRLPKDARDRLVNAAGVLGSTKGHSRMQPSLTGLAIVVALVAWLDANTEEGDYWSPRGDKLSEVPPLYDGWKQADILAEEERKKDRYVPDPLAPWPR